MISPDLAGPPEILEPGLRIAGRVRHRPAAPRFCVEILQRPSGPPKLRKARSAEGVLKAGRT